MWNHLFCVEYPFTKKKTVLVPKHFMRVCTEKHFYEFRLKEKIFLVPEEIPGKVLDFDYVFEMANLQE